MSFAAAARGDDDLGERRHVAQPEVQPLPGQRMDAVRRVAGRAPAAGSVQRSASDSPSG